MMNDKHDKVSIELLEELFRRVGVEVDGLDEITEWADANGSEWYTKRSWTEEESNAFKEWAVAHIRKRMRWSKKGSERAFSWFILNYGWSHK